MVIIDKISMGSGLFSVGGRSLSLTGRGRVMPLKEPTAGSILAK